ncbi:MAG: hypothetical protein RJB66_662 [Pseudomonadota bacterium]|jgi:pimeloyl-ACP methyl ester carboxylesterase
MKKRVSHNDAKVWNAGMKNRFVLIRGLARGNAHWADFTNNLISIHPNLTIELLEIPGNGDRNREVTPIDASQIIEHFRRDLNLAQSCSPVRLIGISLGGMLALKWAELYPQDLESVFVINSSLRQFSSPFERLSPGIYTLLLKALLSANPRKRESLVLKMIVNNPQIRKQYLNQFTELSIQNPISLQNFIRQLLLAASINVSLSPTVPLRVITSKKDKMVHFRSSLKIAQAFAGKLHIHPTAGHDIPLDDPEWLAEILLDGYTC